MNRFLFLVPLSMIVSACSGGGGGTTLSNFNSPAKSTTLSADTLTSEVNYQYNNGVLTFNDPELATGSISAATDSTGEYSQLVIEGKNSSATAGSNREFAASGSDRATVFKSADETKAVAIVTSSNYSYQTFGFWATGVNQSATTQKGGYYSTGTPTANSALIAQSGTATFTGRATGTNYASAGGQNGGSRGVDSSVTLTANFSNRTAAINFTGSKISTGNGTSRADSSFDMSGSLGWTSAANKFSGTLNRNDGSVGVLNGRFYGPNAEEAGGVFYTKNSDSFYSGAFGVKKQ